MNLIKIIFFSIGIISFMTLPSIAHDVSKHTRHDGKHKSNHYSYGRASGPPSDIPGHIKSRIMVGGDWSTQGTAVNLNNSQVGLEGITFLAGFPEIKGVTTLALKTNQIGDEGLKIISEEKTFQSVKRLSLWDNQILAQN